MAEEELPRTLYSLGSHQRMFGLAVVSGLYALLRPVARREIVEYFETVESAEDLSSLADWAGRVIEEHGKNRWRPRSSEIRNLFNDAPKGLFRSPQTAYRPRILL